MPKSRNRYSRARIRRRVRRPRKRGGSRWFYATLTVIVAGGATLLALNAGGAANDVPPRFGLNPATGDFYDHWHSAIAVNICGSWLEAPPTFENVGGPNSTSSVRAGLHTHGDGFIHIHPYAAADGGNNATLGRFFHDGGWGLSEDSMNLWSGTTSDGQSVGRADWSNGDKCPKGTQYAGKSGVVKWSIDCKSKSGNPADYKLHDLQVIALAFLPKSADIGVPPNASATPSADANSNPKALNVQSCSTAGPGGEVTTTTIAGQTTTTTPATTTSSTP